MGLSVIKANSKLCSIGFADERQSSPDSLPDPDIGRTTHKPVYVKHFSMFSSLFTPRGHVEPKNSYILNNCVYDWTIYTVEYM